MPNAAIDPRLNRVNMLDDGSRFCSMCDYPGDFQVGKVDAICRAWGVVERHCVEDAKIAVDQAVYMLRFADDLWRKATFGALGGTPQAWCSALALDGPTGAIASLRLEAARALDEVLSLEMRTAAARDRFDKAKAAISRAVAAHEKE